MEEDEKKIQARIDVLKARAKAKRGEAERDEAQSDILKAWAALLKLGMKFGDRFRITGKHYGQVDPEGILTGHDGGSLVGSILDKTRNRVTGNDFVFHGYRLNDIVPLGPDKLGERFIQEFDASALLSDEEADNV